MFFPEWSFLARLCGASSLNAVVLPREVRLPASQGGNEALHKDLRKLLAGKELSPKGYDRLLNAYLVYSSERGVDLKADTTKRLWDSLEMMLSDDPGRISLADMQRDLLDSFSESSAPRAAELFCNLLVSSVSMKTRIEQEGTSALLHKLKELDDPAWSPFFAEISQRLKGANEVPKDVSEAVQIMGGLSVFLAYWFEPIVSGKATIKEQKQAVITSIKILFAEKDGEAHPQKAVAALLEHAYVNSGCATKADFIKKAFGASNVREAYKYFSGEEIPTFDQTRSALRASGLADPDNPGDDDVTVIIVQFMARSYRHLNERLDKPLCDALKPHFVLFDHLQEVMQAHTDAGPASIASEDQSVNEEPELS